MKRLFLITAGLGASVALAAALALTATAATRSAATSPTHAKILIRHETHGCHAWSKNGGIFRVSISAVLARGGTTTFTDNDVMSHKLVKTSGPAVRYYLGHRAMLHMGASVKVTFPTAGTYHFTTKAGEDYPGISPKTIGEDNVLRLTVKVS